MFMIMLVLKLVLVLLSIAFVTLFERKVLGFSQLRLGPNKVMFIGLLQPVIDGIKLFIKELYLTQKKINWGIFLGPVAGFMVMLFIWLFFFSLQWESSGFYLNFLFFIIMVGMSVYSTLISGWSATSKYSVIGGVRSCSQSVSYEVALVVLLMNSLILFSSLESRAVFLVFSLNFIFLLFWSCLAETNRAPLDFSEGESELISGFNIEFGSGLFVLLFLAEYGMILFFSFCLGTIISSTNPGGFGVGFFLLFIFIRSVYPRFRYDFLMNTMWLKLLPISLIMWLLFFFI